MVAVFSRTSTSFSLFLRVFSPCVRPLLHADAHTSDAYEHTICSIHMSSILCKPVSNFHLVPTGLGSEPKWIIQSESMQCGLAQWQGAGGECVSCGRHVSLPAISPCCFALPVVDFHYFPDRLLRKKWMTSEWENGKQTILTAAKVGCLHCCRLLMTCPECQCPPELTASLF